MTERINNLYNHHQNIINLLESSISKNRLVHTYLFEGVKQNSKFDLALLFSSMIISNYNGEKFNPDSKLTNQIFDLKHPSVFVINPENGVIKKEQIQNLMHEFSMTSLQNGPRIFIINQIESANISSSNAILKFLEEANNNCYGILITDNIKNVLETIISRSVIVKFNKVNPDEIYDSLAKEGYRKDVSFMVSKLTTSVLEAKEMIAKNTIIGLVDQTKKLFNDIYLTDHCYTTYLEFVSPILKSSKDDNTNYYFVMLDILIELNRILLQNSIREKKELKIYEETMETILNSFSIVDLYDIVIKKIETLVSFRERLKYNVNIETCLAQLFTLIGEEYD